MMASFLVNPNPQSQSLKKLQTQYTHLLRVYQSVSTTFFNSRMDFFKSVFSDPTPDPSPPSTPTAPPNPDTTPPTSSSWPFGSTLFRTLASKSDSLIDNYYKDLQDFSTGLKKETSVIRQAATRAVQDLPARLESGAAIAQESLEAVGQAIDNVGSTVSEIIGKDLNFSSNDSDDDNNNAGSSDRDLNLDGNSKSYSRIEAAIRALQCDIRTYCDHVEENAYDEWGIGFRVEEKREEIDRLVRGNSTIKEIYNEIVPVKVDEETFWCRYFYRVDKVVRAEEARARIVKKAILGEEEEELSWDFDDDDNNDNENKSKEELKKDDENRESGDGKRDNGDDGGGVSGTKSDVLVDDEKEVSDGKIESDISVISSQRAEDDLGWDEIEDIGSDDESKVSNAVDLGKVDLGKRMSCAEEELTWDIDDDEEEELGH